MGYIANNIWLVVWNMAGLFFHSVGNVIMPIDELIFFRGVGQPPTRSDISGCPQLFFFPSGPGKTWIHKISPFKLEISAMKNGYVVAIRYCRYLYIDRFFGHYRPPCSKSMFIDFDGKHLDLGCDGESDAGWMLARWIATRLSYGSQMFTMKTNKVGLFKGFEILWFETLWTIFAYTSIIYFNSSSIFAVVQ